MQRNNFFLVDVRSHRRVIKHEHLQTNTNLGYVVQLVGQYKIRVQQENVHKLQNLIDDGGEGRITKENIIGI